MVNDFEISVVKSPTCLSLLMLLEHMRNIFAKASLSRHK